MKFTLISRIKLTLCIAAILVAMSGLINRSESTTCLSSGCAYRHIEHADLIFAGVVRDHKPYNERTRASSFYTFEVTQVWRGDLGLRVDVQAGGGCSPGFRPGVRYLVYAHEKVGRIYPRCCPSDHKRTDLAIIDRYLLGEPAVDRDPGTLETLTLEDVISSALKPHDDSEKFDATRALLCLRDQAEATQIVLELEATILGRRVGDSERATTILGFIGPPAESALRTLVWAFENGGDSLRGCAVSALARVSSANANFSAPYVIAGLTDTLPYVRIEATRAVYNLQDEDLGELWSDLLSAIVLNLEYPDAKLREASASLLGNLGKRAKDALPALELLKDADPEYEVRKSAEKAVERITTDLVSSPN